LRREGEQPHGPSATPRVALSVSHPGWGPTLSSTVNSPTSLSRSREVERPCEPGRRAVLRGDCTRLLQPRFAHRHNQRPARGLHRPRAGAIPRTSRASLPAAARGAVCWLPIPTLVRNTLCSNGLEPARNRPIPPLKPCRPPATVRTARSTSPARTTSPSVGPRRPRQRTANRLSWPSSEHLARHGVRAPIGKRRRARRGGQVAQPRTTAWHGQGRRHPRHPRERPPA